MTTAAPRHLVAVWNPQYRDDAMDEHLRLLIQWAERYRERRTPSDEDVFVWWGKVRSSSRTGPLPHLNEVLALQAQIEAGTETHLYLTDYRSLYVAHLGDITTEDVREDEDEGHIPDYYGGMAVEIWFRLMDVRRIVFDDTLAVNEELRRLHNVNFHDSPVSIYGGMVNLPLVVTRAQDMRWFADLDILTGGRLWAERDAELRGEVARVARELRENLLGDEVWAVLESGTRNFLNSGDAVFRTRRDDPGFDFSATAVEYAKALEAELNALVFPAAARAFASAPTSERTTYVDGRPLDLKQTAPHVSLGVLATLLEKDEVLRRGLKLALPHDWKWLTAELPHHLAPVVRVRNPAAHSAALTRDQVAPIRNKVLGIGEEGLLVHIAGIRRRA